MLRFFNSNTPLILIMLPLIMLPFWLPAFMSSELMIFSDSSFVFNWIQIEFPFWNRLLAFVLIVLSGIQLNLIINNNEFFDKNTYIPSLIYVLFMSSFKELHQLHPIVISNLFWILAYRRLMNVYNQVQCKSEIFDASFFILLGGIFNPPFALTMLLFSWITLGLIRPFDLREYAMPLLASVVLGIYVFFYFYFFGNFDEINLHSAYYHFDIIGTWHHYITYALFILLMYGGAFKLISLNKKSSIRFRKITSKLMIFIMLTIVTMLGDKLISQNDAFILYGAVPLSILFSFLFYHQIKSWYVGLLFYSLISMILYSIYLT